MNAYICFSRENAEKNVENCALSDKFRIGVLTQLLSQVN